MHEPDVPMLDSTVVRRTGAHLERFAAALSPSEQDALRALLAQAADSDPLAALAASPPDVVLRPREVVLFERLCAERPPSRGSGRPMLTVILKATRLCNLRCTYCHSWKDGPNQVMTFPVLARAIRDALRDPDVRHVNFVWHGGEATLLPPAFYRRALWLQGQFRQPGQIVENAIQTNGTRLSDDWLDFLRRYGIGVGVSLDGPPEIHDRRRLDASGRTTAARVREGLERLRAAGITRTGVLMVVDDDICNLGAARMLDYLLETGIVRVALLNVLPANTPANTPVRGAYLPLERFVEFLCDLFQAWWPAYRDRLRIRELDELVIQLSGGPPQTCVFAGDCFGGYLTIEPAGEVSACDKYIGDDAYRFGNLLDTTLTEVQMSPRLAAVRVENRAAVDRMRTCPWFAVCQGGCPHDRYTGERRLPGFNDRCCGFAPLLADIASALRAGDMSAWGESADYDNSTQRSSG